MDILIGVISILIGPFILITGIILASMGIAIIPEAFHIISTHIERLQNLIKKRIKVK